MLFKLIFLHLRSTKLRFSFPSWKLRRTINQSIPEKGIAFPDTAFYQERATPPAVRLDDGASSAEPNTHTHTQKISKSLFVMLQRWNGQAWAVTLNHPWVRSLLREELEMTRTRSSVSRPCCCWNVIANAHLASVASAEQSKLHSTPPAPKPPAALCCDSVCQ